MAQVRLKRGDTAPEFVAQLKNIADDQELDESATVRFYMETDPDSDQSGQLLVNQPVSQVGYTNDPPTITYDFQAGETSIVGNHIAEAVVTFADGEVQSFPSDGYWRINISEPVTRDVPPTEFDPPDITVGVVSADEVNARALQAVERISGAVTSGKELTDLEGANLKLDDQGRLNSQVEGTSASHTNPTYDSDEDGTIDADVDNQNTTSEVGDFGSLSVGETGPVTGIVGNSDEWVTLGGATSTLSTKFTNTTFDYLTRAQNTPRIRTPTPTGIDAYRIVCYCTLGNYDGNTSTIRFDGETSTDVSYTGISATNPTVIGPLDYTPNNDFILAPYVRGKVDGGEGYFSGPTWEFQGRIA